MKSMADGLPPEIVRQLHPDWRRNEVAYWAAREQLLPQYEGQWVAFADGKVVASGRDSNEVFFQAAASGRHPFFTCVGQETAGCRMRRVTFPYDTTYPVSALPLIEVEFRAAPKSPGVILDQVIPDTGADASLLPWADCQSLHLDLRTAVVGSLHGVTGPGVSTLSFYLWASLDGQDFRCRAQVDFTGQERIVGRDVLNQLDILFRGPTREVVVNP